MRWNWWPPSRNNTREGSGLALSGQGRLLSFTLGGRAGFTLCTMLPTRACTEQNQGGLDCVRHVAAQKPLAGVVVEVCEVPRLLQARDRDHPQTRKATEDLELACFPGLNYPMEGQLETVSAGLIQQRAPGSGQLLASWSYVMDDLCSINPVSWQRHRDRVWWGVPLWSASSRDDLGFHGGLSGSVNKTHR